MFLADRRTDMTKAVVAFRNFTDAPKKENYNGTARSIGRKRNPTQNYAPEWNNENVPHTYLPPGRQQHTTRTALSVSQHPRPFPQAGIPPSLFLRNALKHATVFWYCLRHMTVTDKLRQDKCRLCVSVRWVSPYVGALLKHLSSLQAWSV